MRGGSPREGSLARKIAAITLIVWKNELRFDANHLKPQAA
jgi:hypothetical protein